MSYQELLKYPILMLDKNSTTSEYLHALFQQHQLDLVPEVELSSNDLLIDLARIGLGIASVSYTHLDVYKRQFFYCLVEFWFSRVLSYYSFQYFINI